MKKSIISAAALLSVASVAHAADAPAPAPAPDDSLTYHGITFYGVIDIGLQYQTEGTPINASYPNGGTDFISKTNHEGVLGLTPSNVQQSRLGLKGTEDLVPGLSAFFKVESYVNPQSGMASNGPASLQQNNGLALVNQTASGDSSKAGQFLSIAYFGLSSPTFGDLAVGRQLSLLTDDIIAYDPMNGSFAFSLIGASGTLGGGFGITEAARFDQSVKYNYKYGPLRVAAQYAFSGSDGEARSAYEFDVGGDYAGFSVDAIWGQIHDGIALAAQGASSATTNTTADLGLTTLTGTVSDNTGYGVFGKYAFGSKAKAFVGYEHIQYDNPATSLGSTFTTEGYTVVGANNAAFTNNKVLTVEWIGAQYFVTPKFDITGAFYREYQNGYADNGCTTSANSKCSGDLNAFALRLDYHLTKRFDVYGGAMFSEVEGGLANGFLKTSTIDPTIGARFVF